MKIVDLEIPDLKLITLDVYADDRGFFVERFHKERFDFLNWKGPIQDNFSRSKAGVLRGLHYQHDPAQGKLVTCVSGQIFDVAVDLRTNSSTFGKCVTLRLSGDRPEWFWIPAGFAHGFCVLGERPADLLYKVDVSYNALGEGGLMWNDPDLSISWPLHNPILSPKDRSLSSWRSYQNHPQFGGLA